MRILFGMGLFLFMVSTFASTVPIKRATDQRLQVVAYAQHNVVPIDGAPFVATQIVFAKDEYIEDVQNGDLAAWTVSIDKHLPYMFFVKPTAQYSNTNMTVVTNKRTYYFHLQVGGKDHRQTTYALQFIYPKQQQQQKILSAIDASRQQHALMSAFDHPGQYHWHYSFSGDRQIVPLHVFDDGKFTYMQLQKNQAVPAVFIVNNAKGREAVVNYRRRGHYLIIEQIAPQFTLRVGQHQQASIFNDAFIRKLRKKHWFKWG